MDRPPPTGLERMSTTGPSPMSSSSSRRSARLSCGGAWVGPTSLGSIVLSLPDQAGADRAKGGRRVRDLLRPEGERSDDPGESVRCAVSGSGGDSTVVGRDPTGPSERGVLRG